MKKLLFLIMFISLCLSSISAQQKVNEAQVRQQIGAVASRMKSMQCDFVQTKHLRMLNEKMVSRGKMYYQQGNRLRWEYTSPYAYTFVINGSKVLIRKNKRSDVINVNQSKMSKEIARHLSRLILRILSLIRLRAPSKKSISCLISYCWKCHFSITVCFSYYRRPICLMENNHLLRSR